MSPALPDGVPVPDDGALPASVAAGADERDFGVYLHIPFCTVRCGYCDFNTYTAEELGGGSSRASYAATALREIEFAATVLHRAGLPRRPVSTVFLGGGTPTVLPPEDLLALLRGTDAQWGLAPGAEVTVEANPDSVTRESLHSLAAGGVTRVSFGMQSAVPHVLATLDRTHAPDRIPLVVHWAREAGLAVSVDLIYGTPGETLADWQRSLAAAVALEPDHISAYALVVEPGTRLAARVRRGKLPAPDPDDEAAKYELADDVLAAAGFGWYEVSNWARSPEHVCRHNVGYWRGQDWWGIGPGAHSHVGGVRWWNVKHPRAYADRIAAGLTPAAGREVLSRAEVELERVLLGVRLSAGLDLAPDGGSAADGLRATRDARGSQRFGAAERRLAVLVEDGLLEPGPARAGRAVLTRRGRLLADAVVRTLTS
jgi:putative oxygen-independent coproporphyrinogen III oxidase